MGIDDGGRHETRRFVGGVAEHHPLIAGALAFLFPAVDALRDVGRLAVQMRDVFERVPAEILVRTVVAYSADHTARDLRRIDLRESSGGDFAHIDHDIRPHHGFAGDSRVAVRFEARIQHGIGYLIGYFVGMSFGNGLRRKNVTMFFSGHFSFPVRHSVPPRQTRRSHRLK